MFVKRKGKRKRKRGSEGEVLGFGKPRNGVTFIFGFGYCILCGESVGGDS